MGISQERLAFLNNSNGNLSRKGLYKGLNGKARIPTDDLIPKTGRCSHFKAFQLPSASIEAYKCSFFPQTIRDWSDLPDSLFSTAELSDDCVSKFASLVRSRV